MVGAKGLRPDYDIQQADAVQAYLQANIRCRLACVLLPRDQRLDGQSLPPFAKINCTKPPKINVVELKEWLHLQRNKPSALFKNPLEKMVHRAQEADGHGGGALAINASKVDLGTDGKDDRLVPVRKTSLRWSQTCWARLCSTSLRRCLCRARLRGSLIQARHLTLLLRVWLMRWGGEDLR